MSITVNNTGPQIDVTITPIRGPQGEQGIPGPVFSLANLTFVESLSDLPTPVGNVITLPTGAYQISGAIDLTGNRLELDGDVAIYGTSSETASITSTGLSTSEWLITATASLPMRNVSISGVQKGVRVIGPGGGNIAVDWTAVNFVGVPESAWVTSVTNFIQLNSAYLSSGGARFSGTIGTVGFNGTLFAIADGLTGISFDEGTVITRRVRVDVQPMFAGTGSTAINLPTSVTIPNGNYIIHRCNFSGPGTPLAGVTSSDNRANFTENVGIENTSVLGFLYMQNNATATPIAEAGVAVKVLGTTTNSEFTRSFSHTDNRLTYEGSRTVIAKVSANCTLTAGNNQLIGVYIAKNGVVLPESEIFVTTSQSGRSENVGNQAPLQLSNGDYIELWVENAAATTAITVQALTLSVKM